MHPEIHMKSAAMTRIFGPFSLLLALAITSSPLARERPFVDEPSTERRDIEDGIPWSEDAVITLPDYPNDTDLVEFSVDSPGTPFRYFIDKKSLAIGSVDQVVRYTLVIQSSSGARNVSFEGLRCDAREYKTYAFGTSDRRLRPLPHPHWMRIKLTGPYRHHLDLRQFYFCQPVPFYRPYDTVAEILQRLRTAPRLGPNDDLF